ncbi:ATP synthase-coupling factor 6, mitochondrial [Pimephales promelas]|nr:ATP synthase-coupling factor 6, mitochondrial [Pimephales promelas]
MSFQRVWRLRVLKKFHWLDDSVWKVPLSTPLCTKANNVKKPVRYTSIKKAKPKTIIDIARLLQQKTKETKERKESVILKAATSTTKPATPNQLNDEIVSNAKVHIFTSTLPDKVNVEGSATPVDSVDVEAVTGSSLNMASKMPVAVGRTDSCESAPATALFDSAVDFAYSKCVDQMATVGRHNKSCTEISNAKDAPPKAVESAASNAPHEPSTQEDMTTISRVSATNTKGVDDAASASKNLTPDVIVVSDEIVHMPEVMVTSKAMATPEVSSAHEDGPLLQESEVVTVTNASTFVNITQARYSSQPQFPQFIASDWSSNVNTDKTPSSREIINHAVGSFPVEYIMDISRADAVAVACGEGPTLPEDCHEEAIPVSELAIPEVSLFKSAEDLPVVDETISASLCKKSEKCINLKDPTLAQTDEVPDAQLDPVKRLFLDKIREYSTKSQPSGSHVDAGPEYEKVFNEELTKLQRLFGGGDLSKFPEFRFSEPVLDESNSK